MLNRRKGRKRIEMMNVLDALRKGFYLLLLSFGVSSPAKKPKPASKPAPGTKSG
jgi:hypothetical protein